MTFQSTTTASASSAFASARTISKLDAMHDLLGTWTLHTDASVDIGYYKAKSFLVMHVLQDPLRVYSCQLKGCDELNNQACQQSGGGGGGEGFSENDDDGNDNTECLDTETNIVEWSDVSVFFQFGFTLTSGAVWKTRIHQDTSGWLGPYNVVLARNQTKMVGSGNHSSYTRTSYVSRYVSTLATDYLQPPVNISLVPPAKFDAYAGAIAVQQTIHAQPQLHVGDDAYGMQQGSCDNGNAQPILPRFQWTTDDKYNTSSLQFDFQLLSIPEKKDPLYKQWPSFQKHLEGEFPIQGPYCYNDDSKGGYVVDISVDTSSSENENTTDYSYFEWTKGCIEGLPCWPGEDFPPSNSTIPDDNHHHHHHSTTDDDQMNRAVLTYACYFLALILIISLVCNCQLSMKLKHLHRRGYGHQHQQHHEEDEDEEEPTTAATTREELEEPLLAEGSETV